jgi:PLP dependent protein
MSIKENLLKIQSTIPNHVTLVAVSKTKPISDLMEAYNAGQRIFGENKIQEMTDKWEQMPKDIEWHMIGHVQTNKVKFMAPFVKLIHGVESLKLLIEINKQAQKNNRIIDCLFQIFIATEETKFGLLETELNEIIESTVFKNLQNINIVGLMGMASFTNSQSQIETEFQNLKQIFDKASQQKSENFNLKILSMGMSNDYQIAISHGSNMIRVGSSIFGTR